MVADSSMSGEVRSPRGSTEHEYDKFLSLGGSATREGIADHICTRLIDAESTPPIFVFTDAEDLPMGSQFGSQLLNAIVGSTISIPIPSENYAASKWYLCELVLMPIYDGVENLTGCCGEAFHSHEMRFEQRDVEAGQQALGNVSFLKGGESEQIADGHQGEFVGIVVEMVLSELRQGFWVDVPVGIDAYTEKIIGLLGSTRAIGMYGMGGIGKTTFTYGEFVQCSSTIEHSC